MCGFSWRDLRTRSRSEKMAYQMYVFRNGIAKKRQGDVTMKKKDIKNIKKRIKKKENKFYSLSENFNPDHIYIMKFVERGNGKNEKRRKS